MLAAVIASAVITSCAAGPRTGGVDIAGPPGMTETVRRYAECIGENHWYADYPGPYGGPDWKAVNTMARCRRLEPPGMDHAPGSPANERCSEQHHAWYLERYPSMYNKTMAQLFAETACAGGPPGDPPSDKEKE